MWNRKCMIIQVIIGAAGMAAKCLQKKMKTITGTQSIDSLKKRRIYLEIPAIKRRVLLSEI